MTSGARSATASQDSDGPRVGDVGGDVLQPHRLEDHLRGADAGADVRGVLPGGVPQRAQPGVRRGHGGQLGALVGDEAGGGVLLAEDPAHLGDLVEDEVEGELVGLVGRRLARRGRDVGGDAQVGVRAALARRRPPRGSTPSRRRRGPARGSSTASEAGFFSARTGARAAASARSAGGSPSAKAVPTSRSPAPRASTISVAEDLMVTMRCGGAARVASTPQLVTVSGNPAASGAGAAGPDAAEPGDVAAGAAPHAARASATAAAPSAGSSRRRHARSQNGILAATTMACWSLGRGVGRGAGGGDDGRARDSSRERAGAGTRSHRAARQARGSTGPSPGPRYRATSGPGSVRQRSGPAETSPGPGPKGVTTARRSDPPSR